MELSSGFGLVLFAFVVVVGTVCVEGNLGPGVVLSESQESVGSAVKGGRGCRVEWDPSGMGSGSLQRSVSGLVAARAGISGCQFTSLAAEDDEIRGVSSPSSMAEVIEGGLRLGFDDGGRVHLVGGGRWDPGGSDLLPFFHGRLKGPTNLGEDGGSSCVLSSIIVGFSRPDHLTMLLPECGFAACDIDFFLTIDDLRRRSGTDNVAGDRPRGSLVDGWYVGGGRFERLWTLGDTWC